MGLSREACVVRLNNSAGHRSEHVAVLSRGGGTAYVNPIVPSVPGSGCYFHPRMPSRKKPRSTKARTQPGPFELVWSVVKRVPRGRVVTYGQVAEMIGHRLSPVGVGWAIRAAPEESIPWHRVVNGQGGISTDREHPGLQRSILEAERIVFDAEGRIDLARFKWRPSRRR
jgi:methylated-DNA-protein-cysteine methyltransferase related protein